jgi:hypothetical protein
MASLPILYPNHAANSSSILSFETGPDFIKIEFKNGLIYKFSHRTAGRTHVTKMKELAEDGRGLSNYIRTNMRLKEVG